MPKIIDGTGRRRQPRRPASNVTWERKSRLAHAPGERFGRLTLVRHEFGRWVCHCDCGRVTRAATAMLTSGKKKSCGCLKESLKKQDPSNGENARYDLI
jgi:hypothetical protein